MSNIKPIVLTVTGDEPVEYTFTPNGFPAQDVAEYFDKSSGIPVGSPRIRITTRRGNSAQDPKVTIQLDVPELAETSPSTSTGVKPSATRAFNSIAKVEFFIPRQGAADNRDVVLQLIQGLMSDPTIVECLKDLDFPY